MGIMTFTGWLNDITGYLSNAAQGSKMDSSLDNSYEEDVK